jgi:hypothetical protein
MSHIIRGLAALLIAFTFSLLTMGRLIGYLSRKYGPWSSQVINGWLYYTPIIIVAFLVGLII